MESILPNQTSSILGAARGAVNQACRRARWPLLFTASLTVLSLQQQQQGVLQQWSDTHSSKLSPARKQSPSESITDGLYCSDWFLPTALVVQVERSVGCVSLSVCVSGHKLLNEMTYDRNVHWLNIELKWSVRPRVRVFLVLNCSVCSSRGIHVRTLHRAGRFTWQILNCCHHADMLSGLFINAMHLRISIPLHL